MYISAYRYGIGVAFLVALLSTAPAQERQQQPPKEDEPAKEESPKKEDKAKKKGKKEDAQKKDDHYRQFFRQPETVADYWRAMQFEIEVGRMDIAAQHLRGLMNKKPSEADLLDLEEEQGMSNILMLRQIRKWDDDARIDKQAKADVEKLIQGVTTALEKHLSNQERIAKFVKNLAGGEPEEREYAIKELDRSGPRMIPAYIARLIESRDEERHNLLGALPKLGANTVPPLLAALSINDRALQADLIDVFIKRGDRRAVPHLWYLAGADRIAPEVRSKAREAITYLLQTKSDLLPSPKRALTEEAQKYYKHQIAFPDREKVQVWRWDGKNLVSSVMTASRAEEYYGLHFAKQALDIDPSYHDAQVIFLSLAIEKAVEPLGYDQPLTKGPPAINELLASVNPQLVTDVLERALNEKRTAVILGAARALGGLAEIRAQRPVAKEEPALVRALKYPDTRVQLVAADALLRIPGMPTSPAAARVVEVLRRTAAAEPVARVLIADGNRDRAMAVADAAKKAGFEPITAATGREALRLIHDAADIDIILIDQGITDPQLPHVLPQLRADMDMGLVPVLITEAPAAGQQEAALDTTRAGVHRRQLAIEDQGRRVAASERADKNLEALAKQYPKVWVIPAIGEADRLKAVLGERVGDSMGRPFTDADKANAGAATDDRLKRLVAERQDHADRALIWLGRLAKGEVTGYDVTPAADTLLNALRYAKHGEEATAAAISAVGRLHGAKVQGALADFVLDDKRPAALRSQAAVELTRHIQQRGKLLTPTQTGALDALAHAPDGDADLKANAALILGSLRPDSRATGERLKSYNPPPAQGRPAAKEKEKGRDKEKEKEKEKGQDKEKD
jgi:CheY-like chemotaxis protein